MPEELTDEQKKANRAEINRQNAKKSTGPKSQVGKMKVRCPASTTFPCQRQLFLPIDDNYFLGKAALAA